MVFVIEYVTFFISSNSTKILKCLADRLSNENYFIPLDLPFLW